MTGIVRAISATARRSYSAGELMLISTAIIAINLIVSVNCPNTYFLEDDIAFYDTIWRNVLGYRLGIDYHNPIGFGPFQLAALLWKAIGPQEDVLKLANALFALPVVLLACVTARRYERISPAFALVFCAATAFELSSPNSFGFGQDPTKLGLSGFYNRISIACLSVLFLHAFVTLNKQNPAAAAKRTGYGDTVISAILLYFLFLLKISAFIIGIFILFCGIISYRNKLRGAVNMSVAVMLSSILVLVTVLSFRIGFNQIIEEYLTAGRAKGVPSLPKLYNAILGDPFLLLSAILLIFAYYVLRRGNFRNIPAVVFASGACLVATFLLNLSNEFVTVWMFPPALAVIAATLGPDDRAGWKAAARGDGSDRPDGGGIAVIPAIAFLLVLSSQVAGTLAAILGELSVAGGMRSEYVVSGGKSIQFRTICVGDSCEYEKSITDGVGLIKSLGLTNETIATLSHSNPFPVLLLSRPQKGTHVWWNFGFNVPKDADLEWQDVLGDATVVMVPFQDGNYPDLTRRLLAAAGPTLARDFDLLRTDSYWKVYRAKRRASQ